VLQVPGASGENTSAGTSRGSASDPVVVPPVAIGASVPPAPPPPVTRASTPFAPPAAMALLPPLPPTPAPPVALGASTLFAPSVPPMPASEPVPSGGPRPSTRGLESTPLRTSGPSAASAGGTSLSAPPLSTTSAPCLHIPEAAPSPNTHEYPVGQWFCVVHLRLPLSRLLKQPARSAGTQRTDATRWERRNIARTLPSAQCRSASDQARGVG
jgi:hypothetical protein